MDESIGESIVEESIEQSVAMSRNKPSEPSRIPEAANETGSSEEDYSQAFDSQSHLSGTMQSVKQLQDKAEEIKQQQPRKQSDVSEHMSE